MAFGGVPTGNKKSVDTAIPATTANARKSTPNEAANGIITGTIIAAVPVLLATIVMNIENTATINSIRK